MRVLPSRGYAAYSGQVRVNRALQLIAALPKTQGEESMLINSLTRRPAVFRFDFCYASPKERALITAAQHLNFISPENAIGDPKTLSKEMLDNSGKFRVSY